MPNDAMGNPPMWLIQLVAASAQENALELAQTPLSPAPVWTAAMCTSTSSCEIQTPAADSKVNA
jgi:hypothetical protein